MNRGRFKFAANFIGIFIFVSFVTRFVLLAMTYDQADTGFVELMKVF